jgi:hypothetical protein
MARTKSPIGIIVIVAFAAAISTDAASSRGPDWLQALNARSDALNRQYGLAKYVRTTGSSIPAWRTALMARSDALNRKYGLGNHAK